MKKISRFSVLAAFVISSVTPLFAAAQSGINTSYITPYTDKIIGIINNILVPVLMAIAFIVFLYGAFKYFILGAAEEKSREEGRQFVLWGVIGFVIILSVWALVGIVGNIFGLTTGGIAPTPPTFN